MKTLALKVDGNVFICSRDIESKVSGKKLQNISKEIIKHEENLWIQASAYVSISQSIRKNFSVCHWNIWYGEKKRVYLWTERKNVMQSPRTEIKDAIKRTMFYDFFSCCRGLISRYYKLHGHKFSPHNDRRPLRHNRCDFFNFSHYKCDTVPASLHAWMLTSLKMNLWRYERK